MIWILLCGLFYGWLLRGARQESRERARRERILAHVKKILDGLGADCPMEVRFSTCCSDPDDLPFSEEPLPDDEAELPDWLIGTDSTNLCRAGYVDNCGKVHHYDSCSCDRKGCS